MVIAVGGLFVLTGSTGGGSGSGGGSAEGAEPRRPGRLRKRAQVSTERRIIDEHWHDRGHMHCSRLAVADQVKRRRL